MADSHSRDVEQALRKAGWFPGRRIALDPWNAFPGRPFRAACDVLSEFGGLHIGDTGPGIACARSDVDLRPSPPNRQFVGFPKLERAIGEQLYPIGVAHRANLVLLIDESGRIYELYDDLDLLAPMFGAALEQLLLGKR